MNIIKFLTISTAVLVLSSCNSQGVTKKELKNEVDSVSYALGLNTADQMKKTKAIDKDLFIQGLHNGMDSTDILIDKDKINLILRNFFNKEQERQQKERFADIQDAGIKFLDENKSKEGVKVTESGLQYMVINEGTGTKPVPTSKVKVHYHGTSIDGKVFDSSVDKGKPIELGANQFVKGFSEGLLLMNVGSKYKFFIPQELGYGASPNPRGPIKPYQALVFEVELLEIVE